MAISHAKLNPKRFGVNNPRLPSQLPKGCVPATKKKYHSHNASPNANAILSPLRDRWNLRIVISFVTTSRVRVGSTTDKAKHEIHLAVVLIPHRGAPKITDLPIIRH